MNVRVINPTLRPDVKFRHTPSKYRLLSHEQDLIGSPLKVYDRWGLLIYSNPSYKNDWYPETDELTSGVYYYLIESDCYGQLRGPLTLIK